MAQKKHIAVIFGGRSVEHDVSILTGLQFIEALDPTRYTPVPIYVDQLGHWWTGTSLLSRSHYPVDAQKAQLVGVLPSMTADAETGQARFTLIEKGLLGKRQKEIMVDMIVPAIHGLNGEDGTLQGFLSFAGLPYAGCRPLASALCMDKWRTKQMAASKSVRQLPAALVAKPEKGTFLDEEALKAQLDMDLSGFDYPFIVKPRGLGSSVGVSRATSLTELTAALLTVFQLDTHALIEPFVDPLEEFNIAVRRAENGQIVTSAIEKPRTKSDLLDFSNKYLAGGSAGGAKMGTSSSEGMASLNRTLNPASLSAHKAAFIHQTAVQLFDLFDLAGSVRIDFLSQENSDDIWFNEINTIPGSFAYFLWEEAEIPLSFARLADFIVTEGAILSNSTKLKTTPYDGGSVIFTN